MEKRRRPGREELEGAREKGVEDVIGAGLKVVFCGINPGLYSAAVGHHFARPGNRFWPALHRAGFTERELSPFEDEELLNRGYGITNIVSRATGAADELSREEFVRGAAELEEKMRRYRPGMLAVLGIGAYRQAFSEPKAAMGRQGRTIGGVGVWVLPNPSGLNAHHRLEDFVRAFREVREAVEGT